MRRSRLLILVFIASFGVSGLVEGFFTGIDEAAATFAHAIAIAVICFAWCRADSEERNIAPPAGSTILCGILPAIGVPLHLFRTRRFGAAVVATIKSAAVLAVSLGAYAGALYLVYFARA